jgi:hypothetical protein
MGNRSRDGAGEGVSCRVGVSARLRRRRRRRPGTHDFACARYERIDELVWVKTNQLQGLIRTGEWRSRPGRANADPLSRHRSNRTLAQPLERGAHLKLCSRSLPASAHIPSSPALHRRGPEVRNSSSPLTLPPFLVQQGTRHAGSPRRSARYLEEARRALRHDRTDLGRTREEGRAVWSDTQSEEGVVSWFVSFLGTGLY